MEDIVPRLRNSELDFLYSGLLSIHTELYNINPQVEFAEPNYTRSPSFATDPRYAEQWALNNTGQLVNGVSGPANVDINWLEAMEIYTSDTPVVVAVIDSGVAYSHDDLWRNHALLRSDGYVADFFQSDTFAWDLDGLDNDESGKADDAFGWDFFDNDRMPFDENGHGTLVASIIAAGSNNNIGIAGIAPNAWIIPIRIFNDLGQGNIPILISDLVYALDYALKRNSRIINLSLGGTNNSLAERLIFDSTNSFIDMFPVARIKATEIDFRH